MKTEVRVKARVVLTMSAYTFRYFDGTKLKNDVSLKQQESYCTTRCKVDLQRSNLGVLRSDETIR